MNLDRTSHQTQTHTLPRWQRFLGEARTRILIGYILLMAFFLSLSIPAIRQRLFWLVDGRVNEELVEEITILNELLAAELEVKDGVIGRKLKAQDGNIKIIYTLIYYQHFSIFTFLSNSLKMIHFRSQLSKANFIKPVPKHYQNCFNRIQI